MKKAILEIIGFDVKDIITTSPDQEPEDPNKGDLEGDFEWGNTTDSNSIYNQ